MNLSQDMHAQTDRNLQTLTPQFIDYQSAKIDIAVDKRKSGFMEKSDSNLHMLNQSDMLFLPQKSSSSLEKQFRTKSRDRSSSPREESANSYNLTRNPPISSGEVHLKEVFNVKSISDLNESQTERFKMLS